MFFYFENQGQTQIEPHTHEIKGKTTFNSSHNHLYQGFVDIVKKNGQHVHTYTIHTVFENGHRHEINGQTGPAVYMSNGEHFHPFNTSTTEDGYPLHEHELEWKTGINLKIDLKKGRK